MKGINIELSYSEIELLYYLVDEHESKFEEEPTWGNKYIYESLIDKLGIKINAAYFVIKVKNRDLCNALNKHFHKYYFPKGMYVKEIFKSWRSDYQMFEITAKHIVPHGVLYENGLRFSIEEKYKGEDYLPWTTPMQDLIDGDRYYDNSKYNSYHSYMRLFKVSNQQDIDEIISHVAKVKSLIPDEKYLSRPQYDKLMLRERQDGHY